MKPISNVFCPQENLAGNLHARCIFVARSRKRSTIAWEELHPAELAFVPEQSLEEKCLPHTVVGPRHCLPAWPVLFLTAACWRGLGFAEG